MSTSPVEYLVALAGNPNCGKTTLFNEVTGSRQHVGNYPGITVEKKEGFHHMEGAELRLVDLPGTYSLTAYSLEELVARDFLVQERPHAVVNIVDASNLERNLYLTVQLLELGAPVVLALNMMDAAEGRGILIDVQELSRRLQVKVIPTVARTGRGKKEAMAAALEMAGRRTDWTPLHISYGPDIDPVLDEMERLIVEAGFLVHVYPPRWTALKYLEADEQVMERGKDSDEELSARLEGIASQVTEHLQKTLESYPEAIIADHRYGFISALLRDGVVTHTGKSDRLYLSDQIDRVVTSRFFGPMIMMAVLYLVYQLTFGLSALPVELLEAAFGALGDFAKATLPDGPLKSLLVSGVIDGVGGVMGFVPLILFMFFSIAFLEDTGYLARVAYMLDRIFRSFGLHGSSTMAFIISGGIAGGCAVPGVMATRTLRTSRERMATLLTAPFMNCGAKIPVFAMLIAAFFSEHRAQMMFLLTVLSWTAALLLARLIRSTILRGPSSPFLLELPPYRMPTFKGLLIHTWERTWQYIKKAGTIILAISILFWALMSYPGLPDSEEERFAVQREVLMAQLPEGLREDVEEGRITDGDAPGGVKELLDQLEALDRRKARSALVHSYAGRIGMALEDLTQYAGFDWRTNVALLSGFAAKEIIISTMGTAYSLGEGDKGEGVSLSERLSRDPQWNALKAFAFIVFIMLYAPCFATVVCIVKESGAWKWGVFSMVFNTTVAFILAAAIYQGGRWLGMGL